MSDRRLSRNPSHAVSILLLLGLAVIWGYNWVVLKIGVEDAGPVAFAAIRMMGGALILLVVMLAMRRGARIVEPWTIAAIGLLQTTGTQGLIAVALRSGQAGKSAVLNYTLPVWVLILGFLVLHTRPRPGQWIAAAVALCGILIMAFVGGTPGSLEPVLYALGASFCWGVGVIITESLMQRHPGKIDTLALTTWQMLAGSTVLVVIAFLVPEPALTWSPGFILAVIYNVGPATAIAFLLWFTLQRRIEPNTLALAVLIVPLIGVVSGWLQLGERPSQPDMIGMAMILVAIAVMVATQRRGKPAAIPLPPGD